MNLKGCFWPDEDTACTRLKNIALCVSSVWCEQQGRLFSWVKRKRTNGSEDCGYSRILHSPENGMNRCDCVVWKWSSKGQGYFMSLSLPTFGLLLLKPRQTEGWKAKRGKIQEAKHISDCLKVTAAICQCDCIINHWMIPTADIPLSPSATIAHTHTHTDD